MDDDGSANARAFEPLTLVEFLAARIADDELSAVGRRGVIPGVSVGLGTASNMMTVRLQSGHEFRVSGTEFRDRFTRPAPLDPRIIAECQAKRRILADFLDAQGRIDSGDATYYPRRKVLNAVLRALATVYADHVDYRDGWRP